MIDPYGLPSGERQLTWRRLFGTSPIAGAVVKLDASGSRNPDGDNLNYQWMYYPEPGSYGDRHDLNAVRIRDSNVMKATVTVPDDVRTNDTIHIILIVTEDGDPPLTRYRRLIIQISV